MGLDMRALARPLQRLRPCIFMEAVAGVMVMPDMDMDMLGRIRRKPVFSIRFLLVGVPYHSEYLNGVADLVAGEDLDHEELWEPNDLKIPVYNTETGNYFFTFRCIYADSYL
jgi:hypothetical protein